MKDEFIIEKNWKYIGNCGCSPDGRKYKNDNYPNWEIRIYTNNMFSFREDGRSKVKMNLKYLPETYTKFF